MNCPHCGAENGERNLRCSSCGKPMSQGPAGTMPQSRQPLPEQDRQGFLQPPPGMKSYSERPTYRDEQPAAPSYKPKVFFAMNRRLLPSVILLVIVGSLFIIATYMPWIKSMGGKAELTGWDLYHAGKAGLNGGNALYIPDVLKINNDYDAKSGALLTGLWTLTGGILLLVLAIVVPLLFRPYLLNVTVALGLALLIVTGINLVTMLVAGASLLWPIYVLPPASLIVIVTAIDAHRAF
jgi:hypothetical protein